MYKFDAFVVVMRNINDLQKKNIKCIMYGYIYNVCVCVYDFLFDNIVFIKIFLILSNAKKHNTQINWL